VLGNFICALLATLGYEALLLSFKKLLIKSNAL
jgi:hypothetical protein